MMTIIIGCFVLSDEIVERQMNNFEVNESGFCAQVDFTEQ